MLVAIAAGDAQELHRLQLLSVCGGSVGGQGPPIKRHAVVEPTVHAGADECLTAFC